MDESDLSAHEDEIGSSASTHVARVHLWTRTVSSQQQEPGAVDEAPATPRIVEFSSIAARNHSPPTSLPSTGRNPARQANHSSLTNGQPAQTSAHSGDRFERTRALLAKYGIQPQDTEWTMPAEKPVQRVERPVRMRIRFWCHRCSTQYGNSRTCAQCTHQRCNRCVRYPPRRSTPRVRLADAARTGDALSTENLHAMSTAEPVSDAVPPSFQHIPTPFMSQAHMGGGCESIPSEVPAISQEISHQENGPSPEHLDPNYRQIPTEVRVRLRHICHECLRTFSPNETACSECGHEQCKDCPRDPPRSRHSGTSPSNMALERTTNTLGSESDGDDEYENEVTSPEAPMDRMQSSRAEDTVTSPIPPSTEVDGIGPQDMAVAPPNPLPPV